MVDVEAALDEAGIKNPHVREYVHHWAELTGAERVEVVSAADDARLIEEALEAGELVPAGEGRYYSRSYVKDTARSEERTIVATNDPKDRASTTTGARPRRCEPHARGPHARRLGGQDDVRHPLPDVASRHALEPWAAGVQLTDTRTVVLHMIRMARVGVEYLEALEDPEQFVRAVHVTGDLENLGQGTPDDQRYFVTVADERTILHFGSSYGGNALLGKIAHGLRQACYDGWASRKFLAEQFMLIGINDKQTGKTYHICGGFPSASGKTNLAMMLAPDALGDRYHVSFYGDDIAWLWVDEESGKLYGMNPEFGVFGVAKDTNEGTNPTALALDRRGHARDLHQRRLQRETQEVWWEGRTPHPPAEKHGWLDWKGDRSPIASTATTARGRTPTAASRPRSTTSEHRRRLQRRGACRSTRSSSAAVRATASR